MLALCLHLKNSRLDPLLTPKRLKAKGELVACQRAVQGKLRELVKLREKRNEKMLNLRDLLSHRPMVSPLISSCPTFVFASHVMCVHTFSCRVRVGLFNYARFAYSPASDIIPDACTVCDKYHDLI